MEIVEEAEQLDNYIQFAVQVSGDSPVLIDRYLRDAIEVDVDALADGETVVVAGVLQHIEEAGVHSGDSACTLPPYSLSAEIVSEIKRQADALARALEVRGLMNVQFAVKDGEVYLIEVNPRASRRSEEQTSELQSLMRISYAVFCLKTKTKKQQLNNKQYYTS